MKKIFLGFITLCMLCVAGTFVSVNAGNNAGGAFSVWPDTGQNRCFNNEGPVFDCPDEGDPFFGQDAQYKGPQRSYTKLGYLGEVLSDNADAGSSWMMTRDNVTGLIWEIKTNDGSIHDGSKTFTWCDSDSGTNGGYSGTCGNSNDITDTEAFVAELNLQEFGGFSDWRLPTIEELSTLLYLNVPDGEPPVYQFYFPNIRYDFYWSATSAAYEEEQAWFQCFQDRCVNNTQAKKTLHYVIAVRSGREVNKRFIDNHDCTITDTATKLMWQKCSMGQTCNNGFCEGDESCYNWEQAMSECEASNFADYENWRLPNRNELESIIDYSNFLPALKPDVFPTPYLSEMSSCDNAYYLYWTSSSGMTDPFMGNPAFYVDLCSGVVCTYSKDYPFFARAVRYLLEYDYDRDTDTDGMDLKVLTDTIELDEFAPEELNKILTEFSKEFGTT